MSIETGEVQYAQRVKGEAERAIALGLYTKEQYALHFPTSRLAQAIPVIQGAPTFRELSKTWLMTIEGASAGTKITYNHALQFWLKQIGAMPIDEIKHSVLLSLSTSQGWEPNYRNTKLIPLRGIFDLAFRDGVIQRNPTDNITNGKVQREIPDPFTLEEVNCILDYMRKTYDPQVSNYFEFAFFTGARPEEIIALKWTEIDFTKKTARIKRVRTAKVDRESTKTKKIRDLELNSRAINALTNQKPHTFLNSDYVFHNPKSEVRWNDSIKQSESYWTPTIKAVGLRYRVAYHTRHTFATMNLMAGANPMWVAKMMGHSNMQMLLTVYATWVNGTGNDTERTKIESMLNSNSHKDATRIM